MEVITADGLTHSELVDRELEVLRKIDGVTSVKKYERQQRQPLNKNIINVRIVGQKKPVTVHCSRNIPDLLHAAHEAMKQVAEIVGSDAVAEGRRRADAEREAAAPVAAPPVAAPPPAAAAETQPTSMNFFEHSKRIAQLEAEKLRAEARVRDADGHLRSALLLVATEEAAVKLAQQRLADSRAAAEEAKKPLVQAQAAAAEIRAALQQLRIKRQRVADAPADPGGPTDPGAEAEEQERPEDESLHYNMYKNYNLATFRQLEAKQMQRRSIIPERGVPAEALRRGKDGAMDHWRHGLVGAVQAWAVGSLETVIKLVMQLIKHFGISAEIRIQLGPTSGVRRATSLCRLHRSCPRRCRHLIFRASTVQMTLARSTRTSWTASNLRCTS